jgi:hypothetical protein
MTANYRYPTATDVYSGSGMMLAHSFSITPREDNVCTFTRGGLAHPLFT